MDISQYLMQVINQIKPSIFRGFYDISIYNMSNIVYILTNEAMPDLIKIGMTSMSLEQRVAELSRPTGVPLPFDVYYAVEVENMREVEDALHDAFLDMRINPKREFFKLNPERVVSILKLFAKKDVTPLNDITDSEEEKEALEHARKLRPKFNFEKVGIPAGSEIIFARNENIKAKVISEYKVEYNGEIFSLAPLSQKLLGYSRLVQGALYWKYENEILAQRRIRLEESITEDN